MLNQISTTGSFSLGASTFIFFCNIYKTWKFGERVTANDPWGFANSPEWVTSCPSPRHNFTKIPRIRSERPAFDLHYPHIRSGRERLPVSSGRLLRRVSSGSSGQDVRVAMRPRKTLRKLTYLAGVAGPRPRTAPDQLGSRAGLALSSRRAAYLPTGTGLHFRQGRNERGRS